MPDNKFTPPKVPMYQRRSDFSAGSRFRPSTQFSSQNPLAQTLASFNQMSYSGSPEGKVDSTVVPSRQNTPGNLDTPFGQYRERPQLQDRNGKINPKYDSSFGRDVLTGITAGASMGVGQDPYFQLGALIGGAVGGMFSKNVAGKQRWMEDVALVDSYNAKLQEMTNAEIRRLEAESRINYRTAQNERANKALDMKIEVQKQKGFDNQLKTGLSLLTTLPSDDIENRVMAADVVNELFRSKGINFSVGADYGVNYKLIQAGENFIKSSTDGRIYEDLYMNGQRVTNLSVQDFIALYKAQYPEDTTTEELDTQQMTEIMKEARQVVNSSIKTGKIKPGQEEAMVFNLGRSILKSKRKNVKEDTSEQRTKYFENVLNGIYGEKEAPASVTPGATTAPVLTGDPAKDGTREPNPITMPGPVDGTADTQTATVVQPKTSSYNFTNPKQKELADSRPQITATQDQLNSWFANYSKRLSEDVPSYLASKKDKRQANPAQFFRDRVAMLDDLYEPAFKSFVDTSFLSAAYEFKPDGWVVSNESLKKIDNGEVVTWSKVDGKGGWQTQLIAPQNLPGMKEDFSPENVMDYIGMVIRDGEDSDTGWVVVDYSTTQNKFKLARIQRTAEKVNKKK